MVLFTLLKTPEPSPERAYSEMDNQSLNISPLPKVEASLKIKKIKKNFSSTQVKVVQYFYLYKYF